MTVHPSTLQMLLDHLTKQTLRKMLSCCDKHATLVPQDLLCSLQLTNPMWQALQSKVSCSLLTCRSCKMTRWAYCGQQASCSTTCTWPVHTQLCTMLVTAVQRSKSRSAGWTQSIMNPRYKAICYMQDSAAHPMQHGFPRFFASGLGIVEQHCFPRLYVLQLKALWEPSRYGSVAS